MIIKPEIQSAAPGLCFTVSGLLGGSECRELIGWATGEGYRSTGRDYPDCYRNNDRLVCHREDLAELLLERLEGRLPQQLSFQGNDWRLVGLNPRFRGCRYHRGQKFERHRDGAYSPGPKRRSLLTVMLYLNDSQEFKGGHTRYYHDRWVSRPYLSVPPRAGMGIVFEHALWHDGEAVSEGTKYVLRTDVIYECDSARPGHLGYIWDLTELDEGCIASGSRDQTIRVWNSELEPQQVLEGHSGSVTSLAFDGSSLYSGSRDHTLLRWRRSAGRWSCHRRLRAHRGTVLKLLSTTGGLYSSGADLQVCRWSPRLDLEESFATPSWPWALCEGPEGLWCGCEGGELLLNGRLVWTAPTGILSLARRWPAGVFIGGRDGSIRGYSLDAQQSQRWTGHRGPVTTLARVDSGRAAALVSGAEDDGVRVWREGESSELLRHDDFVRSLLLRGDGSLISGGYDGRLRRVPL